GQNPLFSIGAHTVHHAMLGESTPAHQAFEIYASKHMLEQWLGRPVTAFAYPYGNFTPVTRDLIREAGYAHAVSTEARAVSATDDRFSLPRMQVKNWCVHEFASRLNELMDG